MSDTEDGNRVVTLGSKLKAVPSLPLELASERIRTLAIKAKNYPRSLTEPEIAELASAVLSHIGKYGTIA